MNHVHACQVIRINIGSRDHLTRPMQCAEILLLRAFARSICEGRRARFGTLKVSDAHIVTDLKLPAI